MSRPTAIIDFTLHRKRKQAQAQGRLLWDLYAQHPGFAAYPGCIVLAAPKTPRQA